MIDGGISHAAKHSIHSIINHKEGRHIRLDDGNSRAELSLLKLRAKVCIALTGQINLPHSNEVWRRVGLTCCRPLSASVINHFTFYTHSIIVLLESTLIKVSNTFTEGNVGKKGDISRTQKQ